LEFAISGTGKGRHIQNEKERHTHPNRDPRLGEGVPRVEKAAMMLGGGGKQLTAPTGQVCVCAASGADTCCMRCVV
jgi:hypothetical protein